MQPWSGKKLAPLPNAGVEVLAKSDRPDGAPLVLDRRVGLGRVALTAFRLGQKELRLSAWPSFDAFLNGCLMRRPPREFVARQFSGIANAYADEILHRARLSPLAMTDQLADNETARLYEAMRRTLADWTERLRRDYGDEFPEKVTAFRPEMAVHGKYREPCPVCGAPVQRIVHAANESNYCATCQTGGKLLADRALSRLLKDDWPRTLEELEARLPQRATPKAR